MLAGTELTNACDFRTRLFLNLFLNFVLVFFIFLSLLSLRVFWSNFVYTFNYPFVDQCCFSNTQLDPPLFMTSIFPPPTRTPTRLHALPSPPHPKFILESPTFSLSLFFFSSFLSFFQPPPPHFAPPTTIQLSLYHINLDKKGSGICFWHVYKKIHSQNTSCDATKVTF